MGLHLSKSVCPRPTGGPATAGIRPTGGPTGATAEVVDERQRGQHPPATPRYEWDIYVEISKKWPILEYFKQGWDPCADLSDPYEVISLIHVWSKGGIKDLSIGVELPLITSAVGCIGECVSEATLEDINFLLNGLMFGRVVKGRGRGEDKRFRSNQRKALELFSCKKAITNRYDPIMIFNIGAFLSHCAVALLPQPSSRWSDCKARDTYPTGEYVPTRYYPEEAYVSVLDSESD